MPRQTTKLPSTKPATVQENLMKAIVQDKYGSTDVLELKEIDKPVVKDDEVLVRVHADTTRRLRASLL